MDKERILILIAVFASSQFALHLSTKLLTFVQHLSSIVKYLYTSNCTGTEINIILLKKFSLHLIFLIKCLLNWLDLRQILFYELYNTGKSLFENLEYIITLSWDSIQYLNSELHHYLCYFFEKWLPMFLITTTTSFQNLIENYSYFPGLGSFAVVILIILFCTLMYIIFLITLVIVRLYKLFLRPLIKMLTMLVNYRRQFVLRSRRL